MPCPDSLLQQGKECWAPPSSVACPPEGSARGYEQTGQAKKKPASEMSVAGGAGSARTGLRAFLPTSGKVLPKQCGACIMREAFQDQHKKKSGRYAYYNIIYICLSIAKKSMSNLNLNTHKCIGLMPFGFDFGSAVSFSLSGLETKLICTRYV